MKFHTTGFKNAEKELGRQLRVVITYGNVTLEEEIYTVTPHFKGNILKSIMKQLDLVLSVDIPLNTVINCQIGILVNNSYEMLNYGNYVVYKSEKQEDTNTYKLTCYDKILYSMKQNEELGITYPISIKNYLNAIARKIGLSVADTTFYNQDMQIHSELYFGLDYTYRDILDEIAQATGSIICLNENDEIQVKYPTQTNDTIDEEYLKDVNVKFGKRYGAINTIVLSRAGESDNVYYPDPLPANPIEIKIVDNQIMNFNNRSDYLEGIYNALNGLYYYINDFTSTGILYYEVGDLYNIQVGENTYQCLMLNDELNVTTGIEEIIHTDMPEQSETDYTKADKTDRRINQTYLIVDKQNQQIEALITQETDQNQNIARVVQTVDELNSKISDIADITTSQETNAGRLTFENINASEPIRIEIHPIVTHISYLYPSIGLFPSTGLFLKTRTLRFMNTKTNEVVDYELPCDLWYYDSENYDEFILDYDSQICIVNKKVGVNANGTTYVLSTPQTIEYEYPTINITDGDYEVSVVGYNTAYLFARLMSQNIYTTQFATRVEMNSAISQKANEINLGVDYKLTAYPTITEMNSAINVSANSITSTVRATYSTKTELGTVERNLTASLELKVNTDDLISEINASADKITLTSGRLIITSGNFRLNAAGNITCTGGTIGGMTITSNSLYKNYTSSGSTYRSGLYIPDTTAGNTTFLFAGYPINGINYAQSNIFLQHNGTLNFRSGCLQMIYEPIINGNGSASWVNALRFRADGIDRYLSNGNHWTTEGIGYNNDIPSSHTLFLYDAPKYNIMDALHGQALMSMIKTDAVSQNAITYYWTDISVWGTRQIDGINNSIYIQGYQVLTSASDERLKENIKDSKDNALQKINNIKIRSFDWRKDKHLQQGGEHVNNGYIAQEVQRVDETLVNYNEEFDTYQMNELNLNALQTKAIQELYKIIQEQKKEIEKLKERIM